MATELSPHEAFDRLLVILNEKNLGWVVTQVEDHIRLGKPAIRRVKELTFTGPSGLPTGHRTNEFLQLSTGETLRPGREVQFRTTEAYTDSERLDLLLSATHQAIVSTASFGKIVSKHFPGLRFSSEQDNRRFAVNELDSSERLVEVARLQRALEQVRAAVR